MGVARWLGAVDALATLARAGRGSAAGAGGDPGSGPLAAIEARLAGVLVSALQKAFEHDRTRLDLEAAQVEAERRRVDAERERAERAFRAELQRQAADRAAAQARLLATIAVALWITSAVLTALVAGLATPLARALMAVGWALLIACIAAAAAWHRQVARWRPPSHEPTGDPLPEGHAGRAAPWLLTGGLAAVAASVLVAL